MAEFKVKRAKPIAAEVTVPGDKSISHRSVMFASLTNGPCDITGFLPSEDCLSTVSAMRALGVKIEVLEENEFGPVSLRVHGVRGKFEEPSGPIDCGNSGTTMRLLTGLLAGQPFTVNLTGDESLSRRPMGRVTEPLGLMGAKFKATGRARTAPLQVTGTNEVKAMEYELPVASAQVKSAILLAGLFASGKTTVIEPAVSRDHTEQMLRYFLLKVVKEGNRISTWGGQLPAESRDFVVPGDISSAAFWIVAAAAQPGSHLLIHNVGLNKTRTGLLKILLRMGAQINETVNDGEGEPSGFIEVRGSELRGTEIFGDEIPNVIDEIPILAVAAACAKGRTSIRDASELRVKESDRINTVAHNLRQMGVQVEEFVDGMEIEGVKQLKGAMLESLGDHRIAMAFSIAGLLASAETVVKGVECIRTSYPGFEAELRRFMSPKVSEDLVTQTISTFDSGDDYGEMESGGRKDGR